MEILIQSVSTLAAIIALLLIWVQLKYQNKQMKYQALTQLHQELIGHTIQKALRFIFSSEPNDIAHPRSEEDLERIELVLNTYDLIGFRVKQDLLPRDDTLKTEWMLLLPLGLKLQEFIGCEKVLRGGAPYKAHFEWLVKMAEEFKAKNYPNCNIRAFGREFGLSKQDASDQPEQQKHSK